MKKTLKFAVVFALVLCTLFLSGGARTAFAANNKNFIRWVEFNATHSMLQQAYTLDLALKQKGEKEIGMCDLLAYITLKNGNNFNSPKKDAKALAALKTKLLAGDKSEIEKYKDNKYYKIYLESYHAALDGIVGSYKGLHGETLYGIKGYFPIAKGFWFNHYDDFGNSREYGFKRRHLGHDMMGSVGTPLIACEGGTITELGWNRYGGWRIGIRSQDTKRYWYYAHLRKGHPYPPNLKIGDTVTAGQVIGYLGVTGYSYKENTNMKTKPHLHLGLQLIFDKSQEDGNGEIWIDLYALTKFLAQNKMPVIKNEKDYIGKNSRAVPAVFL